MIRVQAIEVSSPQQPGQQQVQGPDHQADHAAAVLNLNERTEHACGGTKASFQVLGIGKLSGPCHRWNEKESRETCTQQTSQRVHHDDVQAFVVSRPCQRYQVGIVNVGGKH